MSAYLECALWSSTDGEGNPLDDGRAFAPGVAEALDAECQAWLTQHAALIDVAHGDYAQAEHDLWLTQNHHGAGFWDGNWPEPQAKLLTDAAHALGERDLYVGDDGLIYCYQG